jgi:hypothetical protein
MSLEVVKTKPLKSTTSVEGVQVQMSNGEHYGVTRQNIGRMGWFLRGASASKTGRLSMENVFMKRCVGKPEIEEGVTLLTQILNGADAIHDRPTY